MNSHPVIDTRPPPGRTDSYISKALRRHSVARWFSRVLVTMLAVIGALGITGAYGRESGQTANRVSTAGVTSYTLENGFKVILAPYPSAGRARVSLVIRSGSKIEGYGETGMAHLLEHMLFMGAGQRKSVKEDLTKLNAVWNGTTSADRTNYFATIPADQAKLEELVRIMADVFIDPRFTEEDLRHEMTVVRNEMEMAENSAASVAIKTLMRQSFFWHGYGRPTIGARSDVEKAPFAVLKAFHERNYRPDNAFLIVAGTFDPEPTESLINGLFARARNPASSMPASWTREESRAVNSKSEIAMPSGSVAAVSAWKLPPAINRETTVLQLAIKAICAPEWGLLRKRLVTERKIANSVGCHINAMNDASLFVSSAAGGKDEDPEAMRREMVAFIEEAAAGGLAREDLDRARVEALNEYNNATLVMESFASALESNEVGGDWRLFFADRDLLREIGLEEANAALKKWLAPYGRSDVLVRHREGVVLPRLPDPEDIPRMVAGKSWPAVGTSAGKLPASWPEFEAAVQFVELEGAKNALIQRKTNGDKVWLRLSNRYGNPEFHHAHKIACRMANMLFRFGGAGFSENQLDAQMEKLNAKWNLSLNGVSLFAGKEDLMPALDILLKVWLQPNLPEVEFDRLKASMLIRVDESLSDPAAVAGKQLAFRFDNLPENHPYKEMTFDQLKDAWRSLTYDNVLDCAKAARGLSDYSLVITGDVSRDEFTRLWETRIKPLPKSPVRYERVLLPKAPAKVDVAPIMVTLPNKPNATITGQGMIALTDTDPDFAALRLSFIALGGNAGSRLWQRLRNQEGLSYSVAAVLYPSVFEPRTTYSLFASVASPDHEKAMKALQDEVTKAVRDGFTAKELALARESWLEGRKAMFSNESGYTGFVANMLDIERSFRVLADYDRRMATISVEEMNAAFRKYVDPDKIVWSAGVGSQ